MESEEMREVRRCYENICLYCKEEFLITCGTPLIYLGGCCYGHKDHKNKKIFVFPRKAHVECWLKEKNLTIKECDEE